MDLTKKVTIIVNGKSVEYIIADFHNDTSILNKLDLALCNLQGIKRINTEVTDSMIKIHGGMI